MLHSHLVFRCVLGLAACSSSDAAVFQWAGLGGSVSGTIEAAKNTDGRLELFTTAQDNTVWHASQVVAGGTAWTSWSGMGGVVLSDPVAAMNADGRLDVFVIGWDHAVWHITQLTPGGAGWSNWIRLGGWAEGYPAVGVNATAVWRFSYDHRTATSGMPYKPLRGPIGRISFRSGVL